ncbi:ABC transporter substrate-binding protein [Cohaesibacter gelatinilyticus]|uniref:Amino acid/amide ABC transporter substrate-binding protein, HAAT family n=1 Tax=Cohaesibacter gelatinilyticus TaxID=372072 RepID=A0A285PD26_9HYPH|nr:ABC transporter substrate-binding protein [Cohaesibacter gelatinilyticus]SNZ19654.1 amino acid/amide ABC transporter substrate-binding protein, HAAT family [Cohaesibacter gelatinilyticus]
MAISSRLAKPFGAILKTTSSMIAVASLAIVVGAGVSADAYAQDKSVKIGFVTFLSGGAAGPFGVPARNAAELMIQAINAGLVPAPYASNGIGGASIEPIFVDENSKQKNADYLKLVEKDDVDMVVGYISSGSCKAIAPEAEKAKKLTILFDCGTPQIFEDIVTDPKYTFRTGAHATMDNVAAARYLAKIGAKSGKIAGINQNYAWGQDSWRDFSASAEQLDGSAEVVTKQFPKIYAGQYGSEISALLTSKPDVVHSSFWGGDMEAFIIQGGARGVFDRSKVVLTTGETAMHRLGAQMPDGTVIGARGPHGDLAPKSELNDWFRKAYFDRFGTLPTYPSYKMAQALLGVKAAADKAGSADQDAIISALKGLEWEGPSGKVSMALANGHQAIQDTAYGTYEYDKDSGKATLVDVVRFKAACVNPPAGAKSIDWIKGGFKGARCD